MLTDAKHLSTEASRCAIVIGRLSRVIYARFKQNKKTRVENHHRKQMRTRVFDKTENPRVENHYRKQMHTRVLNKTENPRVEILFRRQLYTRIIKKIGI